MMDCTLIFDSVTGLGTTTCPYSADEFRTGFFAIIFLLTLISVLIVFKPK